MHVYGDKRDGEKFSTNLQYHKVALYSIAGLAQLSTCNKLGETIIQFLPRRSQSLHWPVTNAFPPHASLLSPLHWLMARSTAPT